MKSKHIVFRGFFFPAFLTCLLVLVVFDSLIVELIAAAGVVYFVLLMAGSYAKERDDLSKSVTNDLQEFMDYMGGGSKPSWVIQKEAEEATPTPQAR